MDMGKGNKNWSRRRWKKIGPGTKGMLKLAELDDTAGENDYDELQ